MKISLEYFRIISQSGSTENNIVLLFIIKMPRIENKSHDAFHDFRIKIDKN